MYCILSILDTDKGNKIADDMIIWLRKSYNIITVKHNGQRFEYPGIKVAIDKSIELNEPVLYLHTKGAFNDRIIEDKEEFVTKHKLNILPNEITEINLPKYTRFLWQYEFENPEKYLIELSDKEPMVVCPYSGLNKITWLNGFIMNSKAAKELFKTFKESSNRFYYEQMFKNTKVIVKGLRINNVIPDGIQSSVWNDMINLYNQYYDANK